MYGIFRLDERDFVAVSRFFRNLSKYKIYELSNKNVFIKISLENLTEETNKQKKMFYEKPKISREMNVEGLC